MESTKTTSCTKRIAALCLALLLAALLPLGVLAETGLDTLKIKGTNNYPAAFSVLTLVNKERAKEGLPALKMDAQLMEDAMLRAAEIAVDFGHTRPDGDGCFYAFTNDMNAAGENIAAGYTSAAAVMSGWMNSPGHKANIMAASKASAAFTTIGVGVFVHNGVTYWTQLFTDQTVKVASSTNYSNKTLTQDVQVLAGRYTLKSAAASVRVGTGDTYAISITSVNPGFTAYSAKLEPSSFTWKSSKPAIATVNTRGVVTGLALGKSTITAQTDSGQTVKITVTVAAVEATGVKLSDKSTAYARIGQSFTRKATVLPANATDKSIRWISSDATIASVDSKGKVTAKKAGTVTITAKTPNGKKASYTLTVKKAPTKIALSKSVTLGKGEKYATKVTITPAGAATTRTYASANSAIATVDKNGKITAKAPGKTTITVTTYNQFSSSITVTVKKAPAKVTLSKKSATLSVGKNLTLKATLPAGTASAVQTWESDNKAVAIVNQSGKITAKKKGKATITVTLFNGQKASCALVVRS